MHCKPRLLLDRPAKGPKVSVILLDWGVRESFHSLHYLNRQTAPRDSYELIWVEFYDHEPAALREMALDRWVVLGHTPDTIYHKHRMYNVGVVASRGEVCVICDSDAIFRPTFIESIVKAFRQSPGVVLHIDQVRNYSQRLYPFNYPTIEDVLGEGCYNWRGTGTTGVLTEEDRIHWANMGACLAARRDDVVAVGGSDEHLDYLGYACGPYDLTFRLNNHKGRPEVWSRGEYIYHTWHPNTSGINTDYCGPEDGKMMSLRALHARASGRVEPFLRSPLVPAGRPVPPLEEALALLASRPEPDWLVQNAPREWPNEAYLVSPDVLGWNLFCHRKMWYGLPLSEGQLDPGRLEKGGYPVVVKGVGLLEVQDKAMRAPYPGLGPTARFLRKLWREPLTRLPARAWRQACHLFGRLASLVTG